MNWVHRDGAHAPHGPFGTEAEARAYAMQELRRWPAATFDLLAVVDRLSHTTASGAMWDAGEEFRPLHLGYAALLATGFQEGGTFANRSYQKQKPVGLHPKLSLTTARLTTIHATIQIMLWSLGAGTATPENQQTRRSYQTLDAELFRAYANGSPASLSAEQFALLTASLEICEVAARSKLLGHHGDDLAVDRITDALTWTEASASQNLAAASTRLSSVIASPSSEVQS